jgi:hypothetical protein
MYIDKIDELLDNIIDTTYNIAEKDKFFKQKSYTNQTVKTIVNKIVNKIDIKKLKEYGLEKIVNELLLIFKKFIYLYLLISIQKNFNKEDFINFIVSFKIIDSNIFDSDFNSKILFINNTLKQLEFISKNLESIQNKTIKIDKNDYYQSLQIFLDLGKDIIGDLSNKNNFHNILKYLIYKKIYLNEDKINVNSILEEDELQQVEFKYIEIIDFISEQIDYASVESLFKSKEYKNEFVESIYNILLDKEQLVGIKYHKTLDGKINELFNKKIIIPITDEFIRYHKESEKYDTGSNSTKIDPNIRTNKRDNTKIRYIITKINTVIDLYKDSVTKEASKIFFQPLLNRKAVLINDLEEINIINKIHNLGKIQKEQNEFYNELISFRTYPYINFKDFKLNGFSIQTNKTIEAIRQSNIEFKKDPKFSNLNKSQIEWRVIPYETIGNVVGFAIPKDSLLLTNDITRDHSTMIQCVILKNMIDARTLTSKEKYGFENILNLLRDQILNNTSYTKLPYIIFNKSQDKINKFREMYNLPQDEYYKFLLSNIYDEISIITFEKIINELNNKQFNSFYGFYNFVKNIENKLLPVTPENFNLIEKNIILINSPSFNDEYDIQEDKIPGITSKLVVIPSFPKLSKKKIVIKITKNEDVEDPETNIYENTYCQHNVTWDKISQLRTKSPNQFNQYLYEFFKHYVIENTEKEFICKSCSEVINLKKYINDWTSSTEEGIALSVSLNAQLDELPEYEKYNKSIKNLDKILEKICSGTNLNIFIGNKPQIKIKRQEIIKMLIDLINIQNETMKMSAIERKNRLEESSKKYGINTTLSQYFLFELKNDIFVYSSKDTDKFKKPKLNNIMVYLILLLLSEMTISLIYFFPEDKMLNYFVFERLGYSLFDGLLIRINSSNDVTSIKNYKLLCYTIFILSGVLVKYNLWFGDSTVKKGLINPADQKVIIHTLVDLLNSILEVNSQKTKNFLYEMFASRFFSRLNLVYSKNASKDLLTKLEDSMKKKISITTDRKMIFKTSKNIVNSILNGKYEKFDFGFTIWPNIEPKFNITKNIQRRIMKTVFTSEQITEIYKEFQIKSLNKIAKNYNLDGSRRNTIITDDEIAQLDKKELENLKKKITVNKINTGTKNNEKLVNYFNKIFEKIHENKQLFEYIKEKELKTELYKTIENLINFWESIIGKDVNINNDNIYLKQNVYIINHNYRGVIRPDIIIYTENENKVLFKKDDPYFKQNIFYFWDKTHSLTMYYNAQDLNYIGYKEQGKDYVRISGTGSTLQLKLSIKNKLMFLGYDYLNYKIPQNILDLLNKSNSNNLTKAGSKLINFISDITRQRIINLKNSMLNIQKIFYQIKNKSNSSENKNNFNKLHNISKKFINKFKYIENKTSSNTKFFSKLNEIASSAFLIPIDINTSITYEKDYLYVGNIIKLQNSDHVIISYICNEMKQLIDANNDTFTKTNLIYLFSNIINHEFDFYNLREKASSNSEVKKFILSESAFYNVMDSSETDIFKDLTEQEKEEAAEENYDAKEMNDALDVDIGDPEEDGEDYSGEQLSRQYFVGEIEV